MNHKLTRRRFLALSGAAAASVSLPVFARGKTSSVRNTAARVVIIGGGFGGASCAHYLKLGNPHLHVTLIEPEKQFITCPFSNYVLAGWRTMQTLTQRYDGLRRLGIEIIHQYAKTIDSGKRTVTLADRKHLSYQRLIVAPGIDIKWNAVTGYTETAARLMPHAWKAGPQTILLRNQLETMRNGGVFLISAPPTPYRCPPAPYERAAVVANYLKKNKPKSKIIILDAKDAFPKQNLFTDGWRQLYGSMIEWVSGAQGGTTVSVDTKTMSVECEIESHKGDVINVIPPQSAGRIALENGLTDASGWCPVNPMTFESTLHKNIYVIGDAAIADPMPKSGFIANSQAKAVAATVIAALEGREASAPLYVNTCYSLLAPDYGISVAGVYRGTAQGIQEVSGSGGTSPRDVDAKFRATEARYAEGWYDSITADVWAK